MANDNLNVATKQLLQPETGWKRIDDTDSNIIYNGTGWIYGAASGCNIYNNAWHYSLTVNDSYDIYFKSSNIRLMCYTSNAIMQDNNVKIILDDNIIEYKSFYNKDRDVQGSWLVFEKLNLDNTSHHIKVVLLKGNGSGKDCIELDAIDIDKDGFLLNETVYNYIRNLQPSSNETIVFNKVKKTNLPNTTDNKFAIYFTDNGEIYINDKDGNVVPAINFKTEFLSNNDYKTLQDNNNIDHSKLYMVATDETLNNTKKMNLYYNNQRYVVNNDTIDKSYEVQQKVSLNATPTEPIQIYTNDSNNKMIIDNYKFVEGENDVTSILKEFSNEKKSSFFYNNEEVNFNDTGVNIKNEYKLTDTLNNDTDLYESDIINKSDFIEINEVKLNG